MARICKILKEINRPKKKKQAIVRNNISIDALIQQLSCN